MSAITRQEVFAAANMLAAQGDMPSILSVRKALGNRGSESTLQKYLKEWKANLLASAAAGCVFCSEAASHVHQLQEEVDFYRNTIVKLKLELYDNLVQLRGTHPHIKIHATN
ncbi:MAG: DNA-binding protein [Candidatus Saccharibacteria bacterium]|nr:DNA-binding protein [Candidatus Saccharibacteria bacterium]